MNHVEKRRVAYADTSCREEKGRVVFFFGETSQLRMQKKSY
jgi:hypothetical protein